MAESERGHDPPAADNRTTLEGAPPGGGRALRPAGDFEEVSGTVDAGEESAAIRRGMEGDRRVAQACEGARRRRSENDGRYRVPAGGPRATTQRQRRSEIPLGHCTRRLATLPRRPAGRSGEAQGARHSNRVAALRPFEAGFFSHFQTAAER